VGGRGREGRGWQKGVHGEEGQEKEGQEEELEEEEGLWSHGLLCGCSRQARTGGVAVAAGCGGVGEGQGQRRERVSLRLWVELDWNMSNKAFYCSRTRCASTHVRLVRLCTVVVK